MLAVISLMTAGVFALDVTIPLGHVVWLLYLLPLWLSARLESPTAPRRYALLCTLLFGIGFSPGAAGRRRAYGAVQPGVGDGNGVGGSLSFESTARRRHCAARCEQPAGIAGRGADAECDCR
jgi:hypothetical protein